MGTRTAFGKSSNLPAAISSGIILKDTLILTSDTKAIFYYDIDGNLIEYGAPSVQEYKTHLEFPNVGQANMIYIATDENDGKGLIYRYDVQAHKYFKPFDTEGGGGTGSFDVLYGGSALT